MGAAEQTPGPDRSTEERNRLLGAFERIARAALESLEEDEVLDLLAREVVRAGLFRSLTIALVRPEKGIVEVMRGASHTRLHCGGPAGDDEILFRAGFAGARYPLDDENVVAAVARQGELVVIDRVDDPRLDRQQETTPASWVDKVAYFFPVRKGGQVLAVLATASTHSQKEETLGRIRTLEPLLSQLAIALEHARVFREARELAERLRGEIAERRRVEEELIRTQRLRAVADLAAGVSHNLNNVFATIFGYAQLLGGSIVDSEAREDAEALMRAVREGRDLVDRFLVSTRSGRQAPVEVEVEAAVRAALAAMRLRPAAPPGTSRVDALVELGSLPHVRAQARELRDVVTSIVDNALEAMPRGGTVTIGGRAEGREVVLEIADTGEGMEADSCRRALEPFYTSRPGVGRGLGLSVAHAMVTGWGGRIGLRSAPGAGTTVSVCLPMWGGSP